MTAQLGSTLIPKIYLGSTPIEAMYLGRTRVWTSAEPCDQFTQDGFLEDWAVDTVTNLGGGIAGIELWISDGQGNFVDNTGAVVGQVVKYIPSAQAIEQQLTGIVTGKINLGTLISPIRIEGALTGFEADVCSGLNSLGGLIQQDGVAGGLVAFINGLPVIGKVTSWLDALAEDLTPENILDQITSFIGQLPINDGTLAMTLGIISNDLTGALDNAINLVVNDAGTVLGYLTCGNFKPKKSKLAPVVYPIGVAGAMVRVLIPDGLVALPVQTAWARNLAEVAGDDGWLEVEVATRGSGGLVTQVFRRYDNSGNAASGVGLDLRSSMVSLIVLAPVGGLGSGDLNVAPGLGSFAAGDRLRLVQTGNVHTVFKNGVQLGQWVDTYYVAAVGSGNRSIGMMMQACQDFLGPAHYSPSLHYVCAK